MFQTSTQHDKKQGALLKIDQQFLHTIRQCEPHHASQLDKLDQPAKHLDNSTKSTFEHCKLGKRPTQETPPTLPAIVLDDLNSFAILFSSMSQLISIFSKRLNFQPCKLRWLYSKGRSFFLQLNIQYLLSFWVKACLDKACTIFRWALSL